MKILANQSKLLSVLFFSLLFYHWREAFQQRSVSFHTSFTSVHLLAKAHNQVQVLKLFQSLKIALTHTPLRTPMKIEVNKPIMQNHLCLVWLIFIL